MCQSDYASFNRSFPERHRSLQKAGSPSCMKKANSRTWMSHRLSPRRSASSMQLIREGIFFFSFLLRTRKLGGEFCQWNRGRCKVHRSPPAVSPPTFSSSSSLTSSHVRAAHKTYVHAHARGSTAKYYWTTSTRTHLPCILFHVGLCRAASKEHAAAAGRKFFRATQNSREGLKSGRNAIQ